ncbi:MAG: amidohydrolase family protein, partial [Sandaracinobacteroides sp.]
WGKQVQASRAAGVAIAFGTDAGVIEHGRNAEEFALLVEKGGMTQRAALVSATTGAAELLGLSAEIGTIAAGKSADIIAVTGDPLTDPKSLLKMRFVMASGRTIALD